MQWNHAAYFAFLCFLYQNYMTSFLFFEIKPILERTFIVSCPDNLGSFCTRFYLKISFTDTLASENKKLLGAASKCDMESYPIENI